ncbi:MAG: DUF2510 domain-containing protein [Actinobacteria bacterium]|nr:DUF2510 domain-containing protein [Actinomycetota bacterium]
MQVRCRPDTITDESDEDDSAADEDWLPSTTATGMEPVPPEHAPAPSAPAGWYPDAYGRHQYRYWDGTNWTGYVATDGVQSSDPI